MINFNPGPSERLMRFFARSLLTTRREVDGWKEEASSSWQGTLWRRHVLFLTDVQEAQGPLQRQQTDAGRTKNAFFFWLLGTRKQKPGAISISVFLNTHAKQKANRVRSKQVMLLSYSKIMSDTPTWYFFIQTKTFQLNSKVFCRTCELT